MDEIDAVGRHRGAGLGDGHDEREAWSMCKVVTPPTVGIAGRGDPP